MSPKKFGFVLVTITAMAASASAAAPAPAPERVIELRTVNGGGQTVDASIDGHPGTFMFDSGWGVSSVTPRFATVIGCKPWGKMVGFRATGERLDIKHCNQEDVKLAGLTLQLPTLGVIDIMKYLPKGTSVYAGALGLDAFDGRRLTIRSRAKQLIVESPSSLAKRIAHAKRVSIRLVRDVQGAALTVNIGIPTSAGTAWMELDTGNYGGTMIDRHIAKLVDLDPDVKGPQELHMRVAQGIEFAGNAHVEDLILDGDLGKDFLDQWDLTLDLASSRGWLSPA
ncbi:aspartyl protease family protein [Novacetimonas pomaceti]|uniref:aspartyl protease family protein n=1 Tax=Novacetimonas pomaceti TaxID=2021998 RepID=UPI001C2DA372|nr:aspartyl protease family protein [Novacetimonas pomaceti]MBV1835388.1 aspartyl protease family protein [Novacetimonas pomaceti]